MSNGDSLDGFVFPPFIPTAAARPAPPPAPAPAAPVAEEPAAEPQSGASRMTMPWDVETPIVRESADLPAAATDEAEDEDLPWLERPEPRDTVAEAPAAEPAAPAQDEVFPDWLAWDDRDTDEARSEAAGVAPVEGLEDFAAVDELGGFIAEPPAVEWAEAAPEPAQADASDPADTTAWSLDAPEAVEPPILAESAAELTFGSPEAAPEAEPSFEITLDGGELTFAAAETEPVADEAGSALAVGDVEPAVSAADLFVADEEAVIAAEPDPFTAATVQEAEAAAPVDAEPSLGGTATNGVFADVAARLEDIARTLRERPDDLLSGSASDPLALLVAGYVMGYNARR
jgi:hypothetical protein